MSFIDTQKDYFKPIPIDLSIPLPYRPKCGKCKNRVDAVTPVMIDTLHITDACEDCIKGDAKAREQVVAVLGRAK